MHFQSVQLKQNSLPQAVVHPSFRSIYSVIEEVEDIYKTNSPRAIQYRNFCQLVGLFTEIPPSWEKTLQKKTVQLISPTPIHLSTYQILVMVSDRIQGQMYTSCDVLQPYLQWNCVEKCHIPPGKYREKNIFSGQEQSFLNAFPPHLEYGIVNIDEQEHIHFPISILVQILCEEI